MPSGPKKNNSATRRARSPPKGRSATRGAAGAGAGAGGENGAGAAPRSRSASRSGSASRRASGPRIAFINQGPLFHKMALNAMRRALQRQQEEAAEKAARPGKLKEIRAMLRNAAERGNLGKGYHGKEELFPRILEGEFNKKTRRAHKNDPARWALAFEPARLRSRSANRASGSRSPAKGAAKFFREKDGE